MRLLQMYEKVCLKASQYYSASIWTYNFSISLSESPQPPPLFMSELSNVSLSTKTVYFYLWRRQDTPDNPRTNPNIAFRNKYFGDVRSFVYLMLDMCVPQFLKCWNSFWSFGHVELWHFDFERRHFGSLKLCNFEMSKFEASKLWNQ